MFIIEEQPKSILAESYKTLRTNIQYSSLDKELKVIVVTSSEPGEGKTTTSCNLALSFAQINKKTLIIDCDLRKPNIHKKFNISNLKGLSDILVGSSTMEEVICTYNEYLKVIPAGHISPNPSEMLNSNVLGKLIEGLRDEYDFIILDSAPLLAVTDAQILSAKADGTILVVKADNTKKDSVILAKELLEKVKANIIGLVLNKVNSKTKGYYYYYGEDGRKKRKLESKSKNK